MKLSRTPLDAKFDLKRALAFQWMNQLAIDDLPKSAFDANEKLQHEPWVTAALASNMLLTAELLLKLAMRLSGKSAPRHHNIRSLFGCLNKDAQLQIETRFHKKLAQISDDRFVIVAFKTGPEKTAIAEFKKLQTLAQFRELDAVLKMCSDGYTFWRYFDGEKNAIFPLTPLSCFSPAVAEFAHETIASTNARK